MGMIKEASHHLEGGSLHVGRGWISLEFCPPLQHVQINAAALPARALDRSHAQHRHCRHAARGIALNCPGWLGPRKCGGNRSPSLQL